jgi:hypothetical protein
MAVGGHRHGQAALSPGETQCSLYRRLGGQRGRSGRGRNISPLPGFDIHTNHLVASRYTDRANPAYIRLKELYCIVLYSVVMCCTVLYCNVQYQSDNYKQTLINVVQLILGLRNCAV